MDRELQTFLDYPPLKPGASFNLDTLKAAKDLTGANRDNRDDLRTTPFPQFTRRGGLSTVSPIPALFFEP